jgi:hypothetical protein
MKLQALLGKQATDADIEEIKAEFHPSNTANVNIVPYEIYDEDGTEIVVGEVRKTIDGVKKKKPLYRSVITITTLSADGVREYNYSDYGITNIEYIYMDNLVAHTSIGDVTLNYYYTASDRCSYYSADSNTKLHIDNHGTWTHSIPATYVLEYTKTSDEWTPV